MGGSLTRQLFRTALRRFHSAKTAVAGRAVSCSQTIRLVSFPAIIEQLFVSMTWRCKNSPKQRSEKIQCSGRGVNYQVMRIPWAKFSTIPGCCTHLVWRKSTSGWLIDGCRNIEQISTSRLQIQINRHNPSVALYHDRYDAMEICFIFFVLHPHIHVTPEASPFNVVRGHDWTVVGCCD